MIEKKLFYFNGSIFKTSNRIFCGSFQASTYAISYKQAASNIRYQAKTKLGLVPNIKILLQGNLSQGGKICQIWE